MAPPGPLDRWLQRAPLQPVQPAARAPPQDSQERDQQTADPPSSPEQEQQEEQRRQGKAGTLHAFLVRRDGSSSSDSLIETQPQPRKRRHTLRCTADWQLTGRLDASAAAALHHRHAAAYRQRALLHSHAWQRPVLGGPGPMSPDEAGALVCAQFDSGGELLVAASEEGLLTVHSTAALLAACHDAGGSTHEGQPASLPPPAQQRLGTADPLLVLDSRMAKLQAVAWNGADENVVGLASGATRQLQLYDLQHTQGQPKQVLATPPQSVSAALSGNTAVGLTDLAFFGGGAGVGPLGGSAGGSSSGGGGSGSGGGGGGGYLVLASGMGGQVFLWDARAKSAPSATLAAPGAGAIYACQLAPGQQVVLAGTQSGEVRLWDLRGGSSSTLRFGGAVHHHPPLAAFNLRHALTGVPGLTSQTSIPASAVHSMQLDPCDPRRLAFHLGCGWSGVLDLPSGAITHLHAPAHLAYAEEALGGAAAAAGAAGGGGLADRLGGPLQPPSAAQLLLQMSTAAPGLHRRACWARDGRRFCVPSRRDDSLLLLDFAASPEAGCYALRDEEAERRRAIEGQAAVPSAAAVPLSQAAICAAAHPAMDLLVAGSLSSCLAVAGLL